MLDRTPTVSIVVPALNEARNLEIVLPALPDVHQIILVDGGSVDGTVETALRVRPEIVVVQQTRRGKGNALVCGFEAATGDIIVMFDADGSADPAEIPAFVSALVRGADFAKGSRFCTGPSGRGSSEDITAVRRAGNAGLNLLANILFRTSYSDLCYGYNAFWRRILPVLRLPSSQITAAQTDTLFWGDGFEIESVLSCRVAAAGLRVTEVPSTERRRAFGETNLRTFVDGYRVLRTIVAERSRRQGAAPAPMAITANHRVASTIRLEAAPPVQVDVGHSTSDRPDATIRSLNGAGRGSVARRVSNLEVTAGEAQVSALQSEGKPA